MRVQHRIYMPSLFPAGLGKRLAERLAGLEILFSVKQISPFSSSEFPIVIVGKSPLSAGLVRKHVPLLHPAA